MQNVGGLQENICKIIKSLFPCLWASINLKKATQGKRWKIHITNKNGEKKGKIQINDAVEEQVPCNNFMLPPRLNAGAEGTSHV